MTFDDILASCIEALAQGEPIETCLQRYPAHAVALEPLLRLVATFASEPKNRMSSQAFARGRAELAARAQQRQAQQTPTGLAARQRSTATPRSTIWGQHRLPPVSQPPNGLSQLRRTPTPKTARQPWGLPRLLRVALVLLLLVGTTTLIRYTVNSLPETALYPLKSSGEQVVGILMRAAGEEIAWNAGQAERRLDELARLPQTQSATAQALSQAVAKHWNAVLAAVSVLPVNERTAILQNQLTRFQAVEAQWRSAPVDTQPAAVATLRQMIATGEQTLAATQVIETVATATVMPTPTPTATKTLLLLASPTHAPTVAPVLVASATPTQPPATLLPAPATATPTLIATIPPSATPQPEITAVGPIQEPGDGDADDAKPDDGDEDEPTVTDTPVPAESPTPLATSTDTTKPGITPEPTATTDEVDATATAIATTISTATPSPVTTGAPTVPVTPVATEEEEATATVESNTPPATATEEAPPTPTKVPTQPAATPVPATATPKPTIQPTATKTPKATATPDRDETATPDDQEEATVTAPIETPRPTATAGEATKTPRP